MSESNVADETNWKFGDLDWHDITIVCKLAASRARTDDQNQCSSIGVYVAGEFCGWSEDEWLAMQCVEHRARPGQAVSQDTRDGQAALRNVENAGTSVGGCSIAEHIVGADATRCNSTCREYAIRLRLLEGAYQYKFIVDGVWQQDSCNASVAGEMDNSVLFVNCDVTSMGVASGKVPVMKPWQCPHRQHSRSLPGEDFHTVQPPVPEISQTRGVLQRPVFVYLPRGYHVPACGDVAAPRYPVLYVLDGQDAFSTPSHEGDNLGGGWWLDSQLDLLTADNATRAFIIVAVPNGDFVSVAPLRKREYCPESVEHVDEQPFSKFLLQSVVPYIDNMYRTIPEADHRVLLGFSMAGLYAFLLNWKSPNIFAKAIVMSPSFWFHDSLNVSAYDLVRRDCARAVVSASMSTMTSLCSHHSGTHNDGDGDSAGTGMAVSAPGDRRDKSHPNMAESDGCLSHPNMAESDGCLAELIASKPSTSKLHLYLDSGDGDGDNYYEASCMNDILMSSALFVTNVHYVYNVDACACDVPFGVTHCQAVVRNRVHRALRLFFPPNST